MAIITISRGSYSYGKAIAEKVAEKLNYDCIARDVLLEASKEFNLPEIKLLSAIEDAPSILDRFVYGKEKYIAYIQASLLKYLRKDNVVYHGLGGQFFVKEIPHVLRVRINADIEERVKLVTEREKVTEKKALRLITSLDAQRKKWSKHLYDMNPWDSRIYDLVIHVGKVTVDDAVDIICHTAGLARFQTTKESQQTMDDLSLAAGVKAALISLKRDIQVSAQNGVVYVKATTQESKEYKLSQDIKEVVDKMAGVKEVKINVIPIPIHTPH